VLQDRLGDKGFTDQDLNSPSPNHQQEQQLEEQEGQADYAPQDRFPAKSHTPDQFKASVQPYPFVVGG